MIPVLRKGEQHIQVITCTLANTEYETAVIPTDHHEAWVWSTAPGHVAYDEVTSATVGFAVGTVPQKVLLSAAGGDNKMHGQSPTAGANIYISFVLPES